ncbi:DinB family protein [Paenibacillus sp. FSL K6-2524]|uniref:DinB family protein n=1 Tax=Paenibacillus sp. FSL K6-2524 TaxID=2954516 RepID=UPI0030FA4DE3
MKAGIEMDLQQRQLWNEDHKRLTSIIQKPTEHEKSIELFLNQHALLYSSKMDNSQVNTLEDDLLNNITDETFRKYPVVSPGTKNSIVWHIWHIARIEDMTMNILVSNNDQVLDSGEWNKKLKIDYIHSGNEMTEMEVAELSSNIDINALLSYRIEVGRKTRAIIKSLQPGQFKQSVESVKIKKLLDQGAVKKEATWLLEYWGKKNIAGLILMPATRHNFLHLNKSIRIKDKIQK